MNFCLTSSYVATSAAPPKQRLCYGIEIVNYARTFGWLSAS